MADTGLFRRALRVSPEPMTLSRLRDGVLVDVSESFCRLTGRRRDELVGRTVGEIDLWVDPGRRLALTRRVAALGEVHDFEARLRDGQGQARTHLIGAALLEADGEDLVVTIGHDISDRLRTERALSASEQRYRQFVEHMPLGALITQGGTVRYANAQCTRMSGHAAEDLVGRPFACLVHPDDHARFEQLQRRDAAGEPADAGCDLRVTRRDGTLRHWHVQVRGVDWEGQPSLLAILTDVTEQRATEERLHELSSIVEQASDAIMLTATDGRIRYVNPGFERMTGYSREEVLGRTPAVVKSGAHDPNFYRQLWETVSAGRPFHAQVVNRRKDGTLYHAVKSITPMFDENGRISSFVNIDKDFTVQHEAQQRAMLQALHDHLTGLPNRHLLIERLGRSIAQFERDGTAFALLFIDLDGFKAINDGFGHQAGDEVLREVACRLRDVTRGVDTVARIGGDEFVVLLTGVADRTVAERVADELVTSIRRPIALPNGPCTIGVSVGIGVFPADGADVEALLASADHAMYIAKRAGGNRLQAAPMLLATAGDAPTRCAGSPAP